ncbi:MAG: caspase family protein [Pseudomonadota bacterium]
MIAALLGLVLGAAVEPPTASFALVVGSNQPLPGRSTPLRYADDDAYKTAQVLAGAGMQVWWHARFDEETAERAAVRGYAGTPRPPTWPALRQSLAEIAAGVAQARARGERSVFTFWYAGHGDIIDGEGAVSLEDGVLRRSSLWREVIATPGADLNHVVIDACRAYFVVFDRGAGVPRRPAPELAAAPIPEELARRTGVVLSSAGGEQSFEWEALRSGVFGHELRSALSGAADVDGDGRVRYVELAAFVERSNASLPDPAYRPHTTIRPPVDDDALIDLRRHSGPEIVLAPDLRRHLYLEDALGMRWADLHPAGDAPLSLRLPRGTRLGYLVAAREDREVRLRELDLVQRVDARDLRPRRTRARGAAEDAFDQLFGVPHGRDSLQRFAASDEGRAAARPYAELVAGLRSPPPEVATVRSRPPRPEAPRAHLSVLSRDLRWSDRLPLAAGGERFIAQPHEGEARLVTPYIDGQPASYERFSMLTLDASTRQQVQKDTDALYLGDRVRAWSLVGVGGLGLLAGGSAAIYAFATGVPLRERLLLGMGGVNLALLGTLLCALGAADHIVIGVDQVRVARVAIDPALLERGAGHHDQADKDSAP